MQKTTRRKRFSFVSRFLIQCLVSIGSLYEWPCLLSAMLSSRERTRKRKAWFIKISTLSQFFVTNTHTFFLLSSWWPWLILRFCAFCLPLPPTTDVIQIHCVEGIFESVENISRQICLGMSNCYCRNVKLYVLECYYGIIYFILHQDMHQVCK